MVEKREAEIILKKMLGHGASFRPDQWEARSSLWEIPGEMIIMMKNQHTE